MKNLFAMRRANGDWYALDDNGRFRVPVFQSSGEAMVARSNDSGMECFRPVALDAAALANLTSTDEGKGCYWLVADPLRKLSRGQSLDHKELEQLINNGQSHSSKHPVSL